MAKRLTLTDRLIIEKMLQDSCSVSAIAKRLEKSRATIYNEIKRGTVELVDSNLKPYSVYKADVGERVYHENMSIHQEHDLKVGNDLEFVRYMEKAILKDKLSPYSALSLMPEHIRTKVSLSTLYNYIYRGVFLNVKDTDLPYRRHKRRRRMSPVSYVCVGRSIDERPDFSMRMEKGHWEMDTVYSGKVSSPATLLVLTERKSRYEEIYYMPDRTQKSVISVLNSIEDRIGTDAFRDKYKSITMDNGQEFRDYHSIERNSRTVTYFCHPYTSCERGSNENQNKLIRRWIPKGADIADYRERIVYIQNWVNRMPRKLFNGLSSDDLYNMP